MIRSKQLGADAAVSADKVEFTPVSEHEEFAATFAENFEGAGARTSASLGADKSSTMAGMGVAPMRAAKFPGPKPKVDIGLDDHKIAGADDLDWNLDDALSLDDDLGFGDDSGKDEPLRPKSMFDLPVIQRNPQSLPVSKSSGGDLPTARSGDKTPLPVSKSGPGGFGRDMPTARHKKPSTLPVAKAASFDRASRPATRKVQVPGESTPVPKKAAPPSLPKPKPDNLFGGGGGGSDDLLAGIGGLGGEVGGNLADDDLFGGASTSSAPPLTDDIFGAGPPPGDDLLGDFGGGGGGGGLEDDPLSIGGGGDDFGLGGGDDFGLGGGAGGDDFGLGGGGGGDDFGFGGPGDDDPLGLGGGGGDPLGLGGPGDDDPLGLGGGGGDPLGLGGPGDDPLGLGGPGDDPLGLGGGGGGDPLGLDGGDPLDDHDPDVDALLADLDEEPSSGGPSLAAPNSARSSTYGYSDDERSAADDDDIDLELGDHKVAKKKKPQKAKGKGDKKTKTEKPAKSGSSTKALVVALVVLLLVIVGLGFTEFGPFKWSDILGGDETVDDGATAEGEKPEIKPTTLGPESLGRDNYNTYQEFLTLGNEAVAGGEDPRARALLLAGIAMHLVRYPEEAPQHEPKALELIAKVGTDPASEWRDFGMGAWLAYKGDSEGSDGHLQNLSSHENLRYFGDLLRGVALLQAANAVTGPERKDLAEKAGGHFNRAESLSKGSAAASFQLGRAYIERDKMTLASKSFEKAVKTDPNHIGARLALGRLRVDKGEFAEAREVYEMIFEEANKALAAPSELATAHLLDGEEAMFRNDTDLAIAKYKDALTLSKDHDEAIRAIGHAFVRSGRFQEGLKYFEDTYGEVPNHAEVQLAMVTALLGLGDEALDATPLYIEADEILKSGRKAHENEPRFPYLHGILFEEQGRLSESESAYKTAIDIDSTFHLARIRLARLLATKETPEAKLKAGELIKEVQRAELDAEELTELGRFFLEVGEEVGEGVLSLELATEKNVSWVPAHELLIAHYVATKDLDNAQKHIDVLTTLDAMTPALRYLNAQAHFQRKEYNVAAEIMLEVAEDAPEDAEYQHFLGLIQFARESYPTAQRYFQMAVNLNREHWDARFYLGRCELAQAQELEGDEAKKHMEEALKIFREVHDEQSANGQYHFYLGAALEAAGRTSEAMKEYDQLMRRSGDPDVPGTMFALESPLPRYHRARLNRVRGKRNKALDDLTKALEIDPSHLDTRTELARVLLEDGQPLNAVAEVEKIKEQTEGEMDAELYYLQGRAYLNLDSPKDTYAQAAEALEQARDRGVADRKRINILGVLDPKDVHRELGFLYRDLGRRGDAIRELETYLSTSKLLQDNPDKRREILATIAALK